MLCCVILEAAHADRDGTGADIELVFRRVTLTPMNSFTTRVVSLKERAPVPLSESRYATSPKFVQFCRFAVFFLLCNRISSIQIIYSDQPTQTGPAGVTKYYDPEIK